MARTMEYQSRAHCSARVPLPLPRYPSPSMGAHSPHSRVYVHRSAGPSVHSPRSLPSSTSFTPAPPRVYTISTIPLSLHGTTNNRDFSSVAAQVTATRVSTHVHTSSRIPSRGCLIYDFFFFPVYGKEKGVRQREEEKKNNLLLQEKQKEKETGRDK